MKICLRDTQDRKQIQIPYFRRLQILFQQDHFREKQYQADHLRPAVQLRHAHKKQRRSDPRKSAFRIPKPKEPKSKEIQEHRLQQRKEEYSVKTSQVIRQP